MPYKDPTGAGNKAAQKRYYENNKARFSDRNRRYRIRNRDIVLEAKSVPCMDCGKKYPYYVMQFDHRDPTNKAFTIGTDAFMMSEKRLREEIAKCDVVCANCHAERSHQQRTSKAMTNRE